MIRSVNISFDDMTITGTVESPDARPARYFRWSGWGESVLTLRTTPPIWLGIEFEPGTHVSERAA